MRPSGIAFSLIACGAVLVLVQTSKKADGTGPQPGTIRRVEAREVLPPISVRAAGRLTAQVAVEKSLENRVTPNEPLHPPDFGAVESTRAEIGEIWKRARSDVLVEIIRNEPNLPTVEKVLADLDARNAEYLSAKAKLFEGEQALAAIPSSLAFEGIKKLNDEYRNDVRQLIGDKAFAALNEERQKIQARLALGSFSVPSDLF